MKSIIRRLRGCAWAALMSSLKPVANTGFTLSPDRTPPVPSAACHGDSRALRSPPPFLASPPWALAKSSTPQMHAQHIATRLGPVSIPTLAGPRTRPPTRRSARSVARGMPSFVSSAGYRSPLASPQRPAAAEASGSRWGVPPPATAAATKAAPPVMQEAMAAGPIEAAEQRDAEWLVTLDANDKLIESLAARVRAPPGARLERRLSAPA